MPRHQFSDNFIVTPLLYDKIYKELMIFEKGAINMSQAAETLDGWYSLHLFYAVDWASLRLVPKN